jgi:DNA-binding NtrC family response regulator
VVPQTGDGLMDAGVFVIDKMCLKLESKIIRQELTIVPTANADATQNLPVGLKGEVHATKMRTEAQMIRDALQQNRWNRRMTADQLKISYKALLFKIREYELDATDVA